MEKSLTLSGQPVILQPELLVLTSVIVATAPGFLYTLHRSMFSHMEAASGGGKKNIQRAHSSTTRHHAWQHVLINTWIIPPS